MMASSSDSQQYWNQDELDTRSAVEDSVSGTTYSKLCNQNVYDYYNAVNLGTQDVYQSSHIADHPLLPESETVNNMLALSKIKIKPKAIS